MLLMINCGCIKTTSCSYSLYGRVLTTSAAATGSRAQYTQMWCRDGKVYSLQLLMMITRFYS